MKYETVETYALAAVGAVLGGWKYGPQTLAAKAWTLMGAGILAYELACPNGETLSEGVDRALENHKLVTSVAIGVTALHLANVLPPRVDPYSQTLKLIKR